MNPLSFCKISDIMLLFMFMTCHCVRKTEESWKMAANFSVLSTDVRPNQLDSKKLIFALLGHFKGLYRETFSDPKRVDIIRLLPTYLLFWREIGISIYLYIEREGAVICAIYHFFLLPFLIIFFSYIEISIEISWVNATGNPLFR